MVHITEPTIYQLKVVLLGISPMIWRRLLIRSDSTIADLHHILQIAMGWSDMHLHQFVIRDEYYGLPDEDELSPGKTIDEREYKLSEIVSGENFQFAYDYDFGDNWEHILVVEKTLPAQEGVRYPVCLAGARACPPEDVGGISGYENFLQAIGDPKHPEHQEFLEWIGGEFDPEAFDVTEANRSLRRLK